MVGTHFKMKRAGSVTRQQLAEMIEAIEFRRASRPQASVPTGWNGTATAETLARGVIHEWFGLTEAPEHFNAAKPRGNDRANQWSPPLLVLTHLARRALETVEKTKERWVVWIGRRVWPHPRVLVRDEHGPDRLLLQQSLFVDPPDEAGRLWAIDLALRCPAVTAVVADGSRLRMGETRRVQLAAEQGRSLALLARPPWELKQLSAAVTRWHVLRAPSPDSGPRWMIELMRCKGVQQLAARKAVSYSILEWDRAKGRVRPSAQVVDQPDPATASPWQVSHGAVRRTG